MKKHPFKESEQSMLYTDKRKKKNITIKMCKQGFRAIQ